jgi:hypothetical protein
MKPGNTVYVATLTQLLPAQFVAFPLVWNPFCHGGCNMRKHGASWWPVSPGKGNLNTFHKRIIAIFTEASTCQVSFSSVNYCVIYDY